MFGFLKNIFDPSKRLVKSVQPTINQIKDFEETLKSKTDQELLDRMQAIRSEIKVQVDAIPQKYKYTLRLQEKNAEYVSKEEGLKQVVLKQMPEVYAIIREVLRRKVGYQHFDVQLVASSILAHGYKLTELKTGEGKTLVFQLPAALYGLTGRGAHVVTVNDYLAKRDGEYAGYILSNVGIKVGIITPDQSFRYVSNEEAITLKGEEHKEAILNQKIKNPGDCEGLNLIECTKHEAYKCDVVYGTNNEFGFDYLRDNMTTEVEDISQRELYFCIVDEADSILIDEARTPLIISAPAEKSNDLYVKFAQLVPRLTKDTHYAVDEKSHSVTLTDEGAEKMEEMLGVKNIWQDYKLAHHLENALKAHELYKIDDNYIVQNGEVKIVDDFTGRILEGRRYSEGLHQAIEAKEGVEIKRESKTLGTITFQNFFRLYKILSGGSGTVMTEAEEFYKIYNLECIEIPTNRAVSRVDHGDRVYKDKNAKFEAVAKEVIEIHKKGQPVLVGTASIEDSETVSKILTRENIEHEVLNAKYHERESKIVANAGKRGAVTVATNMAGRGTDIKLGGKNASDAEESEIKNLGGLAVIGTQRHESRRIDNQLRGRSGRQGEPGMSRFYVSLDDDIMRVQGGDFVKRVMEMTGLPDDTPIEAGLVGRSIETAQKRMEGMHFDSRKTVVEYDDVVNQQREIFYSRRRRLLEAIEAAQNKNGQHSNEEVVEKMDYIKDLIHKKLTSEISFIAKNHFVSERSDDIDIQKAVDDFLDLASDDVLLKAAKDLGLQTAGTNYKESMLSIFANKKQNEIEEIFVKIASKAYELKVSAFGADLPVVAKMLVLRTMDELWTDHLDDMKALRDGIGLRGYAQQDPLVEYKNEGFALFDHFINKIDSEIARRVLKVQRMANDIENEDLKNIQTNADELKEINTGSREILTDRPSEAIRTSPQKTVTKTIQIGRNDKVTVKYKDGTIKKDVKFKKIEEDLKAGNCVLVVTQEFLNANAK